MSRALRALRSRWVVVSVTSAAIVMMIAVLPVFGTDNPDADHLRLTDTTKAFFYGNYNPGAPGVTSQPIVLDRGCEIATSSLSGTLVNITSTGSGGHKGPGYVDYGIGVKTGGSNGTPCSQIDGSEKLKIASAASMWSKARLDVEVKGGVWVIAEMYNGTTLVARHELLTGGSIQQYNSTKPAGSPAENPAAGPPYMATTYGAGTSGPAGVEPNRIAACADPNDSGPDANLKDNCLWTLQPGVAFNRVELFALNGVGSVSLEGGSDYMAYDSSGVAAGHYDTLFYRALAPKNDSYSVNEDSMLTVSAPGVLANDGSTSGATVSLVSGVSNGILSLSANGGFTYTPDSNYNGPDSFTYSASSTVPGQLSGMATVNITVNPVNDPPEVSGSLQLNEGSSLTINASDVATDVDGDSLSITAGSPSSTVSVSGGTATYSPDLEFCGSDTISLTVSDGTVAVTNSSIPVSVVCLADDDAYSMDERTQTGGTVSVTTLSVPAPGVLANDTNDVTGVTVAVASGPGSGSLTLNSNGSFDFTPTAMTPAQWGSDTSYDVIWTYTVTYADLSTQTATVTITVNRTLCEEDTVTGQDGNVFGSFTLISATGCKDWVPVEADAGAGTVVFQPNTAGTTAEYEGTLRKEGVEITDGSLPNVILQWDPTPDDTSDGGYEAIPACADTGSGPQLPSGTTGWCFYDLDLDLVGFQTFDVTWRVKGWDDPGFRF